MVAVVAQLARNAAQRDAAVDSETAARRLVVVMGTRDRSQFA
jgi:hypothetical protein